MLAADAAKAVATARTAANCVRPKSAMSSDWPPGSRNSSRADVATGLVAAYPRRTGTGGRCDTPVPTTARARWSSEWTRWRFAWNLERGVGRKCEHVLVRRRALGSADDDTAVALDDGRNGHMEAAGFEVVCTALCQSGNGAAEHDLAHVADGLWLPSEGDVTAWAIRRERTVRAQILLPLGTD